MMRDAGESGAMDAAIQRLDRALSQLDLRVTGLSVRAEAANGGLFDQDRAQLAAELDAARSRERELEAAGAQASDAIGLAIAELRLAMDDADPDGEAADGGQDGAAADED